MNPPTHKPLNLEKLIWEARAKIQWGEAPKDVAKWLHIEGMDIKTIDEVMTTCLRERDAEIRTVGKKDAILGVACLLVSAGLLFIEWSWYIAPYPEIRGRRSSIFGVLGTLFMISGVYKLVRGLRWLIRGGKVPDSMTDVFTESELDPLNKSIWFE